MLKPLTIGLFNGGGGNISITRSDKKSRSRNGKGRCAVGEASFCFGLGRPQRVSMAGFHDDDFEAGRNQPLPRWAHNIWRRAA